MINRAERIAHMHHSERIKKMTLNDLPQVYELFGQGLMAGALMSGIVWAIGYSIKAFIGWINQS